MNAHRYGTVRNVKRISSHPLRARLVVILLPALPTLGVIILLVLFFTLSDTQLVLHLLITLFGTVKYTPQSHLYLCHQGLIISCVMCDVWLLYCSHRYDPADADRDTRCEVC
mgnify:CR=1 FL=1